ncbi:MAG: alpha/beta fold hydrolase [Spirochaetota bacterium]
MPDIKLGNDVFYFKQAGQGEPLVFISGLAGDHTAWDKQVPSHARHFRCITFDNRGIGGSAKAMAGLGPEDYTLRLLADDVARLMDALGLAKAHVAGASMGGAIAQRFAIDHPDRLLSLSLHSTMGRINAQTKLKFDVQLYLLQKLEVMDVQMSIAPMIWSEETLSKRYHIIEAFRAARKDAGPPAGKEVYRLQILALLGMDSFPGLGEIRVPVLVTAGADDGLVPASESALIHKAIPGSQFHVFRGCGHAATVENTRGFNTVSLKFLKRCGGRSV